MKVLPPSPPFSFLLLSGFAKWLLRFFPPSKTAGENSLLSSPDPSTFLCPPVFVIIRGPLLILSSSDRGLCIMHDEELVSAIVVVGG